MSGRRDTSSKRGSASQHQQQTAEDGFERQQQRPPQEAGTEQQQQPPPPPPPLPPPPPPLPPPPYFVPGREGAAGHQEAPHHHDQQQEESSRIPIRVTQPGVPYLGREMVTVGRRREETIGASYGIGDNRTVQPKSEASGVSKRRHRRNRRHRGYEQLTTLSQATHSKAASSTPHYTQATHYPVAASSSRHYEQGTHFPATASSTRHYEQDTNLPATPAHHAVSHLPTGNIQQTAPMNPQAPGTKQQSESTYSNVYTRETMEPLHYAPSMIRPPSHAPQSQVAAVASEVGGAGQHIGRLPVETYSHWQPPLRPLPTHPPPVGSHIPRPYASQVCQSAPPPFNVAMWPLPTLQSTVLSQAAATQESSQALVQRISNLYPHTRQSIPLEMTAGAETELSSNVEPRTAGVRFRQPTTNYDIFQQLVTLSGAESPTQQSKPIAIADSDRQPRPISAVVITCAVPSQTDILPLGFPPRMLASEPIVITCNFQRNVFQTMPQFFTGPSGFTTRISPPPFDVPRRLTQRRVMPPGAPIFTSPQASPLKPSASVPTVFPGTREMEEHHYGMPFVSAPTGFQLLPAKTAAPFATYAQVQEQYTSASLSAATPGSQSRLSPSPATHTQLQQSETQQLTVPPQGFQPLPDTSAPVAIICTSQTQLQYSKNSLDTVSKVNLPSKSTPASPAITCSIRGQGHFAEATYSARQDISDVALPPNTGSHSLISTRRSSPQFVQQPLIPDEEWLPEYSEGQTHAKGMPPYSTAAQMQDSWITSHSRQAQSTPSAVSTSMSLPSQQTEMDVDQYQSQQYPSHSSLQTFDHHVSQRFHELAAECPPLVSAMPVGPMELPHSSQTGEETQQPRAPELQQEDEDMQAPTLPAQGTSSYDAPNTGYSSSDHRGDVHHLEYIEAPDAKSTLEVTQQMVEAAAYNSAGDYGTTESRLKLEADTNENVGLLDEDPLSIPSVVLDDFLPASRTIPLPDLADDMHHLEYIEAPDAESTLEEMQQIIEAATYNSAGEYGTTESRLKLEADTNENVRPIDQAPVSVLSGVLDDFLPAPRTTPLPDLADDMHQLEYIEVPSAESTLEITQQMVEAAASNSAGEYGTTESRLKLEADTNENVDPIDEAPVSVLSGILDDFLPAARTTPLPDLADDMHHFQPIEVPDAELTLGVSQEMVEATAYNSAGDYGTPESWLKLQADTNETVGPIEQQPVSGISGILDDLLPASRMTPLPDLAEDIDHSQPSNVATAQTQHISEPVGPGSVRDLNMPAFRIRLEAEIRRVLMRQFEETARMISRILDRFLPMSMTSLPNPKVAPAGIDTHARSTTSSGRGRVADGQPGVNIAGAVPETPVAGPSHTAFKSDASTSVDFQRPQGASTAASADEPAGTSAQVHVYEDLETKHIIEELASVSLCSDEHQMACGVQSGELETPPGSPVGTIRDHPEEGGTSDPQSPPSVEQQETEVVPPEPKYNFRRFPQRLAAKQHKKALERHSWGGSRASPKPKRQMRRSWPSATGNPTVVRKRHLEDRRQFKHHDKLRKEETLSEETTGKLSQESISHASELAEAGVEVECDKKESDSDD